MFNVAIQRTGLFLALLFVGIQTLSVAHAAEHVGEPIGYVEHECSVCASVDPSKTGGPAHVLWAETPVAIHGEPFAATQVIYGATHHAPQAPRAPPHAS